MALILMLREHFLKTEQRGHSLVQELQAWAREQPLVRTTPSRENRVSERTNLIDRLAIHNFSIGNLESLQRSMRPSSAERFVDELTKRPTGLVLAMLRQNHIVASCLVLAQLARGRREAVFVFDPPDKSKASAVLWSLFEGLDSHVHVFSTAPREIVKAVKRARQGAAVAIAADVITDPRTAVAVPWGEGTRPVMTGAAYIASAAGAALAAVSPISHDDHTGDVLVDLVDNDPRTDGRSSIQLYAQTLSLWRALERQADEFGPAADSLPVPEIVRHVSCGDTLRGCLANLALAHPPLLAGCPQLLAWLSVDAAADHGT